MISINELADMVSTIADFPIEKKHIDGPQGVRGRNSDNDLLREVLGWEPQISLEEGLARTYKWIEAQARKNYKPEKSKSTDVARAVSQTATIAAA